MNYKRIKGTQDILPEAGIVWQDIESGIRKIMDIFNYREIRTPVFEQTALFARGIGQLTDIVSKEMYTFQDKGKKSLTLKPEMTAPVIRAYLENNLSAQSSLSKLYYLSPLFRQENPQAGRLRQFHQFGAEAIGVKSPHLDAEIIMLAMQIYQALGISGLDLRMNSVGTPQSRRQYTTALKKYFKPLLPEYCKECNQRFQMNPLRILDCKNKTCQQLNQNAPKMLDFLETESLHHFNLVKSLLDKNAVPNRIAPYLVRGLDYYTDTVFEITSTQLGAQDAICGGGRYDLLAEQLGGKPTPAVGFASGIERLLMVMEAQNLIRTSERTLDIYVCLLGEKVSVQGMFWTQQLRSAGFKVDRDYQQRSLKAQMRDANKQQAKIVLLLGEDELGKKIFTVKDMKAGVQTTVPFSDIISYLKKQPG
jgi:histidyl-tRNA synthetase